MSPNKLLKKIEKFFSQEQTREEKREQTRAKLEEGFKEKVLSLTKKIKKTKDIDKKAKFKKQMEVLKEFLKKLEGRS